MGSVARDALDRKVGYLNLAREHDIKLTRAGGTLRMEQLSEGKDPRLVVSILTANKTDVLQIMGDDTSVREWLDREQAELMNLNHEVNYRMERWINIESMYLELHPDLDGCACAPSTCRDYAVVRCKYCARRENNG